MRVFRAIGWLGAALCAAVPPAFCADPAVPSVSAPTAAELNMDRYLSIYEDLGAALANVDNVTDADLVAARVAADFLLLRGMEQALAETTNGNQLGADFRRSFQVRREQARTSVDDSVRRLREANCYGSSALPAALTLFSFMAGTAPSKAEAETALQELLSNNQEMMAFLLGKVVDAESAEVVSSLLESACQCKAALAAYSRELGTDELEPALLGFFVERRMKASASILQRKEQLEGVGYYGCPALRECVETVLQP